MRQEEEGFKFCLDTKNNKALPLDWACPKGLWLNFYVWLKYVAKNI